MSDSKSARASLGAATASLALFLILAVSMASAAAGAPETTGRRMTFGRFNSRALVVDAVAGTRCPAPAVVLITGSGANGPEERIPGRMTGDGQSHSIFGAFQAALSAGGVGSFAIGKPGVDFSSPDGETPVLYDRKMLAATVWDDYLANVEDAVAELKRQPCVDPDRVYLLGHSEGTQVAIDFAKRRPGVVKGLILVGFAGESLATIIDWQLYRRQIDSWLSPDVDLDHDGAISETEAKAWPEFHWNWGTQATPVPFLTIELTLRSLADLNAIAENARNAVLWKGVFDRPPLYEEAAALSEDLYVFTGELDVQTRPEEARRLDEACRRRVKMNCEVEIVPGFGHAMSEPRAPRKQKLLDATLGPVDTGFAARLTSLARRF